MFSCCCSLVAVVVVVVVVIVVVVVVVVVVVFNNMVVNEEFSGYITIPSVTVLFDVRLSFYSPQSLYLSYRRPLQRSAFDLAMDFRFVQLQRARFLRGILGARIFLVDGSWGNWSRVHQNAS